jgi:phosphoribosylglycinamide formyltransferase-1
LLLGNGTTLQSVIDNIENGTLNAKINLVVSDNENAYALERAKKANIPTYIINNKTTEEIDIELESLLKSYEIDLIVLVGYLKLIGKRLVNNYTIINTHPSLLPKFGGKGMYGMNVHRAVVEAKEKISGPTVHFVNDKYDEGNIISQSIIELEENETPESLSAKVQAAEKIQLTNVLKELIEKK